MRRWCFFDSRYGTEYGVYMYVWDWSRKVWPMHGVSGIYGCMNGCIMYVRSMQWR